MADRVLQCGHGTHTGLVREQNEDNYGVDTERGVFAVADGMGGHQAGEFASAIAVQEVYTRIQQGEDTRDAIGNASIAVRGFRPDQKPNELKLGSTMILADFRAADSGAVGSRFRLLWVGDSRAYKFARGRLKQVSRDHSHAEDLLRAGKISAQEAAAHPKRGVLSRAMGMPGGGPETVEELSADLGDGEILLLCSDGLYGMVDDDAMRAILAGPGTLQQRADRLIQAALDGGGKDNVTVLLVSDRDENPETVLRPTTAEAAAGPDLRALLESPAARYGGGGAVALLLLLIGVFMFSGGTGSDDTVAARSGTGATADAPARERRQTVRPPPATAPVVETTAPDNPATTGGLPGRLDDATNPQPEDEVAAVPEAIAAPAVPVPVDPRPQPPDTAAVPSRVERADTEAPAAVAPAPEQTAAIAAPNPATTPGSALEAAPDAPVARVAATPSAPVAAAPRARTAPQPLTEIPTGDALRAMLARQLPAGDYLQLGVFQELDDGEVETLDQLEDNFRGFFQVRKVLLPPYTVVLIQPGEGLNFEEIQQLVVSELGARSSRFELQDTPFKQSL